MRSVDQVVPFTSNRISQERVLAVAPLLAGPSDAATQLRAQIRRVAPYFHVASLTGVAGCGEEEVARALHEGSPHSHRPFLALSAADAERRLGSSKVEPISDGFLYLSEAEHLSCEAQAGILKLLRDRARHPPRMVAFVGRGLRPLLSAGLFKPELANLLGALSLAVPALYDRRQDVPLLLRTMLQEDSNTPAGRGPELLDSFLQAAVGFAWPGNLNQMRALVAWLLECRASAVEAADFAVAIDATRRMVPHDELQVRLVRLEIIVQEHIRAVLLACNGNKLKAAEVLGISRSTLYRMLESVGSFQALQLAS